MPGGSFKGIRYSISWKAITNLIHSTGHLFLNITKYWDYLEAGLSGSTRNSNFINSVLSVSALFKLSIFFTLETKDIGGRGIFLSTEGCKAAKDLENLLMVIVQIDLDQQKCDHSGLFYIQKRSQVMLVIYFRLFSNIESCIPILSEIECNMIDQNSSFFCDCLYLLLQTVRDVSDTGTQIHLLVYYLL
jgi:hypothetical protein